MKKYAVILLSFLVFSSCVSVSRYYESGSRPINIDKESVESEKEKEGPRETPGMLSGIPLKVLIYKSKWGIITESKSEITINGHDKIPPSNRCVVKLIDGKLNMNGYEFQNNEIELVSSSLLEINNKKFRGAFLIKKSGSTLLLINKVSMREYLYGVLPSEVSPGWHEELLKAQAVAARTFAVHNKLKNKAKDYDLDSTVVSQVYKGYNAEHSRTNSAVDATEGEILSYNGEVVQSFFHANSGGKTASSEEVWGGRLPYLVSVNDPYCDSGKHYEWKLDISSGKISELLSKNSVETGEIYDMKITGRSSSGRVTTLEITGSGGTITLKGKDFRRYLGVDALKATNFEINKNGRDFEFTGKGWGHGVGLSQEGAKGMAERGRSYKNILEHFYRGAKVVKARIR